MRKLLVLLLSIALLNCSSDPKVEAQEEVMGEQQALARDVKEEVSIGREMAAKLFGTFREYDKKPALEYINVVGRYLAKQVGRPEIIYRFGILDTEEINAFATPGGYILLTKGLLKNIKNESELAGVIAHEIAHVNARHMYKEIAPKRDVKAAENVTRMLSRGGDNLGQALGKAVSAGMNKLLNEGLAPEKEYEADALAAVYASSCGYNPQSLVDVLARLKSKNNLHVGKTHPSFDTRIQKLENEMAVNGLSKILKANVDVMTKRFNENLVTL